MVPWTASNVRVYFDEGSCKEWNAAGARKIVRAGGVCNSCGDDIQ